MRSLTSCNFCISLWSSLQHVTHRKYTLLFGRWNIYLLQSFTFFHHFSFPSFLADDYAAISRQAESFLVLQLSFFSFLSFWTLPGTAEYPESAVLPVRHQTWSTFSQLRDFPSPPSQRAPSCKFEAQHLVILVQSAPHIKNAHGLPHFVLQLSGVGTSEVHRGSYKAHARLMQGWWCLSVSVSCLKMVSVWHASIPVGHHFVESWQARHNCHFMLLP